MMQVKATHNNQSASALIARIQEIVGAYYLQRPPSSVAQDKEVYLQALQEKYLK
ncbi:MAG: hypothetical protein HOP02_07910 [Methylococcaceae bacterium]|nr:hypothetical protein [Methylococcaceae bacterium]